MPFCSFLNIFNLLQIHFIGVACLPPATTFGERNERSLSEGHSQFRNLVEDLSSPSSQDPATTFVYVSGVTQLP
jgi:hypothetical protein